MASPGRTRLRRVRGKSAVCLRPGAAIQVAYLSRVIGRPRGVGIHAVIAELGYEASPPSSAKRPAADADPRACTAAVEPPKDRPVPGTFRPLPPRGLRPHACSRPTALTSFSRPRRGDATPAASCRLRGGYGLMGPLAVRLRGGIAALASLHGSEDSAAPGRPLRSPPAPPHKRPPLRRPGSNTHLLG